MVSNSQDSMSILRMSMCVWPTKTMTTRTFKKTVKSCLPFIFMMLSSVYMGCSSSGSCLSEPESPKALKWVRCCNDFVISGPKDPTLKS